MMGIAALHPSLYGAVEVKRQAWPRTPLAAGISVSLFDRGRFFVPTAMLWSAARSRGQGWPALRGRGRRHRIQATPWRRRARRSGWWTGRSVARSTTRRGPGLGREWRMRRTPHHLVSGPGRKPGTPILHARV